MTEFDEVQQAVRSEGLSVTAAFQPGPEDGAPAEWRSLLLLGAAGPEMWAAFAGSPEHADGLPDPMDRWSKRVINALADRFQSETRFPFDGPPWPPFLKWAQRGGGVWPSRLGMLIDEERGLWTSYRGALGFRQALDLPVKAERPRPCDTCAAPCLTACPVNAFTEQGYDVDACAGHLRSEAGRSCLSEGCLARRACPVGVDWSPKPQQASFHMRAFLASRG